MIDNNIIRPSDFLLSGPVVGSNVLLATPFKVAGSRYPVLLTEVRRFGKTRRYGDSVQYTIGELQSGEIVHFLHKDQSADMLRVIRKRLKGVCAVIGRDRTVGEAFAWEHST